MSETVEDRIFILQILDNVLRDVCDRVKVPEPEGGEEYRRVPTDKVKYLDTMKMDEKDENKMMMMKTTGQPSGIVNKERSSLDKEKTDINRIQQLFGGGRKSSLTTKQVRPNSPKIKPCVRSKLDRCLVHRCPFVKEEEMKRMMMKDDEGKVRCVDKKVEVWKCQKRNRDGSNVQLDSGLSLGGKGTRKDVQNERKHVDAQLPRKPSEKIDGGGGSMVKSLIKKHFEG